MFVAPLLLLWAGRCLRRLSMWFSVESYSLQSFSGCIYIWIHTFFARQGTCRFDSGIVGLLLDCCLGF